MILKIHSVAVRLDYSGTSPRDVTLETQGFMLKRSAGLTGQ